MYTSVETDPFDAEDLTRLLTQSRSANDATGVTGVLLYRRGRFVQYLEGGAEQVHELMQRISADPRHRAVRVLVDDERESRYFSHWTMGFISEDTPPASMPIGFRTAFNDLDAIGDDAAALRAFRDLSQMFRERPGDTRHQS